MNGFLDGENTLTRNPYTKVFEPMLQIKMTNNGNKKIYTPRLVFNNRKRWFTIDDMRNECFAGAVTEKDKALSLWKFFRDNRVHDLGPDMTDNISDPVKLLGVYGYGLCYNTNYSMCFLAQTYSAFPYKGYAPQGLHYVSELNFGSRYEYIDSDIETFYLKNDNTTLANSKEIFSDRTLIRRTKHYGIENNFKPDINNYVASLYYKNDSAYYFGYMAENSYHKLDFNLRPGESILYDWTMPLQIHNDNFISNTQKIIYNSPYSLSSHQDAISTLLLNNNPQTNSAKNSVAANGEFYFKTNFYNAPLSELVDYYSNLSVDSSNEGGIYLETVSTPGIIVIKVTSPFVIVNGEIAGKFERYNSNDSINIFFSKDSSLWKEVTHVNLTGKFNQTFNLSSFIDGSNSNALYNYYLKFLLSSQDSIQSLRIDSLEIRSQFQVSKFFLPQLKLGSNQIEYSDTNSNGRDLNIEIRWKESTLNTPPDQINSPLFPQDTSSVNNLKFTFSWTKPSDQDGDAIVNYEFQLSDRSDMKFPLSPTFETYISETDSINVNPSFNIPQFGLLNDGTKYYWRVRAKDNRGAWGNWSPVWSFVPHGVMPPLNVASTITKDSILISWQPNTGENPAYYEIHGSNEWLGFSPDSSTLIGKTFSTFYSLPLNADNKLFYRIIAVSQTDEQSSPSDVLELPYPHSQIKIDSVFPEKLYLLTNTPVSLNYFRVNPSTYSIVNHQDDFITTILYAPWWISSSGNSASGFADSSISFGILADSSKGKISEKFISTTTNQSQTIIFYLPSAYKNSSPNISNITPMAIAGMPFKDSILISDLDLPYGDSLISISISNTPAWMQTNISDNKILLSGAPAFSDTGNSMIVISAMDRFHSQEIKNDSFSVLIPLKVSFAHSNGKCTSQVSFFDSSILHAPDDTIVSWNWNFGDGKTSFIQNPIHTYDPSGNYLTTLNVTTNYGFNNAFQNPVQVSSPPSTYFTTQMNCSADWVCFFDNSTSNGGNIISWLWNFGDGDTSNQQNPSHLYASSGTYSIVLTVSSDSDCASNFADTINVFLSVTSAPSLTHTNDFEISPNPVSNYFTLKLYDEMASGILRIYNSVGQLVYFEQIHDGELKKEIHIENSSQGIYHLYIRTAEKQWETKFQKLK
ncbi:MAG: PKD domain-containing protein [Bacteroidetes bacterium]|nr:PKD domain-containing protein [Bacteroidota bacterium]